MKLWVILITFLLGLGLGLSLPSLAPQYLDPYVPKMMKPSTAEVKGTVVRKQTDPNRLLLTISSKEGAILATFKKKITEISLLIDEGDTVTFAVKDYAPFVTDPPILRVEKSQDVSQSAPSPSEPAPRDPGPVIEPESILGESTPKRSEPLESDPPSP